MRLRSVLLVTLVAIPVSAVAADPVEAPSTKVVPARVERLGGWLVQETENFRVYCRPDLKDAGRLPAACEALRRQLSQTWLGGARDAWSPKCDVVVHSTVAEYARYLGPGSEQSSGCATLEIEPGRVARRRIDLRSDAADCFDCALPHEMTHVVIAERFTRRRVPRWADEGMAILAEPKPKQERRRKVLAGSMERNRPYTVSELTGLADYPPPERRDLFYGQSASLVAYLIERESPARFLEFVELSTMKDGEEALAQVYGVSGWREFEADWRMRMLAPGETADLLAGRLGRIARGEMD